MVSFNHRESWPNGTFTAAVWTEALQNLSPSLRRSAQSFRHLGDMSTELFKILWPRAKQNNLRSHLGLESTGFRSHTMHRVSRGFLVRKEPLWTFRNLSGQPFHGDNYFICHPREDSQRRRSIQDDKAPRSRQSTLAWGMPYSNQGLQDDTLFA